MLRGGVIRNFNVQLWFREVFNKNRIKFLRANVGDRYVKEKMQKIILI